MSGGTEETTMAIGHVNMVRDLTVGFLFGQLHMLCNSKPESESGLKARRRPIQGSGKSYYSYPY